MTPIAARRMYRDQINRHGETVTLLRGTTSSVSVRARIKGYSPQELASGLFQGDRQAIVLAEDVAATGFPEPIQDGDALMVRGTRMNIESVDDSTKRIGSELIAYVLDVKGA
jgi:hypothetical protein